MIIQCVKCSHENREEARFCEACGASLVSRCPKCDAVPKPGADFCDACGASLTPSIDPVTEHSDTVVDLAGADAERRQLTVLFCDLVGSSSLSEQLDPEDFRDLLAVYQDSCAGVVSHYDGHVARYVGDGLLIYFGYPQAHEDDAPRAVRAALGIVEVVSQLDLEIVLPVDALAVRIGIATGTVVVGDIGTGARREEMAVVGETPNLAARLQALAGPGEVIIAARTLELVTGLFDVEDLGSQHLKGISQSQAIYRVRAESGVLSRLDASAKLGLTPLVGRREEVAMLHNRWTQSQQGELHLVTLSGEAGIGKSRVLRTFREGLVGVAHSRVLYYGSPYHQNSAFHPVIEQLGRALRFEKGDSPAMRLEKLEVEVGRLGLEIASIVPPMAALLSLAAADQNLSTTESVNLKQRQLEALGSMLEAISVDVPLLLVVEDAHWFDPSSLELLAALCERLTHARLLIVMTHRPDFTFSSGGGVNLTQLPLSHLGGLESTAIVTRVAGNKPLPDEVVAKILAKTDGIPLFVEELTKSLLESGVLRDDGNRFVLDEPLPPLAIPPSLQDSLMARLDRLAKTREVAQLAACIGRSFEFTLLSAVSSQNQEALYKALDQLVEAGLIHQRGMRPDITYEFHHALVRDAAYDSLLKSTRQLNHRHIAQALEKSFVSLADAQPELVAQHYTEAGLAEPAVSWWLRAGEKSARLAANQEAIRHLECGLEILETLDRNETRARSEVDMLQLLGIALKVTEGSASEHVEQVFRRSLSLCEWLDDKNREFLAQWGLWHAVMSRGALDQARQQAEQLLILAKDIGKPALELEGHHALWGTLGMIGDLVATRHHAERGIDLYNFDQHGELGFEFGNHDPGVCARYSNALALWLLGYSEQAHVQVEDAMTAARRHRYAPFLSHGLMHCIPVYALLGAEQRVRELGEEALAIARKLVNTEESAYCEFVLGWAGTVRGELADGIAQMESGLKARPPGAFQYYYCHCLSMLAEACYRNDQIERGMSYLHKALEEIKVSNEQWCEAELHRLEGHGHLLSNNGQQDSARACFAKALEVSRAQNAKMLELRAAIDLSRLLRDQGEHGEAFDLLDPVYQWFTEGFETADLRQAKALLEDLTSFPKV